MKRRARHREPPGRPATVGALVAVNAFGDVRDPATGRALHQRARATRPAGRRLVDTGSVELRRGPRTAPWSPGRHDTNHRHVVVPPTRPLDAARGASRVAALAHLGPAAALSPPHLSVDGDALFCLATGSGARDRRAPRSTPSGSTAADCVAEAIVRAIQRRDAAPAGFRLARPLRGPYPGPEGLRGLGGWPRDSVPGARPEPRAGGRRASRADSRARDQAEALVVAPSRPTGSRALPARSGSRHSRLSVLGRRAGSRPNPRAPRDAERKPPPARRDRP